MKRSQQHGDGLNETLVPEQSISELGFHPREFTEDEATVKLPSCLSCIEKTLLNRHQTDTKVIIGSEIFACHTLVLKSYSEYFEKLSENNNVVLPEDKVSPVAFFEIYNWMLSDDGNVPRSNFAEIYKAAQFLNVHELMSQLMCCIDDKKLIGEREALSIYLEAKQAGEKSLQSFMISKISKIFLTFVASWEFLQLNFDEIGEFFKSNRLGVNSELDMLFASIRWLQHEWPSRAQNVARLFKLVRFELIQSWQLIELKKFPKEFEHIFEKKEVQEIVGNALSYKFSGCSNESGDEIVKVFDRRIINDALWNAFEFEKNPNMHENFCNFCKYLQQLDACHWRKLKYADPKHELVLL